MEHLLSKVLHKRAHVQVLYIVHKPACQMHIVTLASNRRLQKDCATQQLDLIKPLEWEEMGGGLGWGGEGWGGGMHLNISVWLPYM